MLNYVHFLARICDKCSIVLKHIFKSNLFPIYLSKRIRNKQKEEDSSIYQLKKEILFDVEIQRLRVIDIVFSSNQIDEIIEEGNSCLRAKLTDTESVKTYKYIFKYVESRTK